ncbi:MAG: SGNH/GDSL hydrolase family protein [Myxococcota bacterium]|nr:SGNH/GDSL hydrolase family protein [Myxococcota bacterium]
MKKLLFAFLPAFALLIVGELSARLFKAEPCKAITPQAGDWETMIGDSHILCKLEPNTEFKTGKDVTLINAVGLRESLSPTQKKRPQEKRVLVTGDSSIYGWGVRDHETYAVYLEKELRRRFRRDIEVINMGVPGYSTEQTIRLLNQIGWTYEPDLVIVSNLFSDCNIDAFQDRQAMELTNPTPSPFQKTIQHSRLYCAAKMKWVHYQANLNQNPNRVLMPGIPTGPNAAVTLEKLNTSLQLSRVPIPHYLENLDTIRREAKKRGANMMLAPLAQEWDVGIWNVPMPKPSPDHVLPWFPYRDAQKEWAAKNNIPQVRFQEVFAEYPRAKAQLFIDNMHPSRQGTQIMAQAVANYIQKHPTILGIQ